MTDGPASSYSLLLHGQKYRGRGESFRDYANRWAGALATDETFHATRDIVLNQRFLPAGRQQAAVGSTRKITPYNCYVSGTIEDSLTDGQGSIMKRAGQAAKTMQMGGGIGYDFSPLRPRNDLIRKLGSRSSGPISFMGIFNATCHTIASAGHRRGAQMGVMRVDHPDIEEFIRAKQVPDEARPILDELSRHEAGSEEWDRWYSVLQLVMPLVGFNISVGVTDEFMMCVEGDRDFDLRFEGEVRKTIRARDLWDMIMRSTWDWAEPGVLFIDRINDANPLSYCERIAATNPCGEQPLPPFGACLLGSFNLVKYLVGPNSDGYYDFNFEAFKADIPLVVEAVDRVIDIAEYPLYEQEKEAKSKRRMGLGVTGVANTLEAMGYPYGTAPFIAEMEQILSVLRDEAYRASAWLGRERGSFPLFDAERYLASEFAQTLPDDIRHLIAREGLRNSHLLSIAPTGTISMCADNVSSGIEPVFAYRTERRVIEAEGPKTHVLEDYGVKFLNSYGRRAEEITAQEHVDVLCAATKYVDSSVSKTCNVSPDMPWADFKDLYMRAWKGGAKGCTTFNPGGKRMGILKSVDEIEDGAQACKITSDGRRECE